MNIIDLIEKKKNNIELTKEEIFYIIEQYMDDKIADYQMSALLMAIYFNGMTEQETIELTNAMIASGDVVDLSAIQNPTVDKHSTGGVGDKVSLILTPILATFDLAVAKMSGRGLGHTGGTLDKLESIDGFKIEIDEEKFIEIVENVGMSIIGQTKELVPADKRLYGLRDVTATVNSIPLIASSIMSKKIASGAHTIILDVKYGDGAFMKTAEDAEKLANALVMIGNGVGRKTIAMVTNMTQPLGHMVGNSLEVIEAMDTLQGKGPKDISDLCKLIACEFLLATDKATNSDNAMVMVEESISSGRALDVFKQFVHAQGGTEDCLETLKVAEVVTPVYAIEDGYIKTIVADQVGIAAMHLGAGRVQYTDSIDHSVGIEVLIKVGDEIKKGDVMYNIYSHPHQELDSTFDRLYKYTEITNEVVESTPIIEKVVR
ncbi:thymidine phosphorylase [Mollicutes bacterium LVI A0078]|nr:thymidine phosphorylase [Mollicutes bacterium LVI A0075]WOO90768.1 thymidine phosphorylase [Mollicutes bacterium LVI A0078]